MRRRAVVHSDSRLVKLSRLSREFMKSVKRVEHGVKARHAGRVCLRWQPRVNFIASFVACEAEPCGPERLRTSSPSVSCTREPGSPRRAGLDATCTEEETFLESKCTCFILLCYRFYIRFDPNSVFSLVTLLSLVLTSVVILSNFWDLFNMLSQQGYVTGHCINTKLPLLKSLLITETVSYS